MVKLDIISDPICPWCYIGKANLDRALEAHPEHPFTIEWHPFQLNPEMPEGGMDRRDYLETKFGGRENAAKVYGRIDEAAKAAGLSINWEGITKTPNTLNAHRLIHWAGIEGAQTAVCRLAFQGLFHRRPRYRRYRGAGRHRRCLRAGCGDDAATAARRRRSG